MSAAVATLGFAKPLQIEDELVGLIDLLQDEGVRSYLEVGVRYGGTFERVMRALPWDARGMAIDFPGSGFGDSSSAPIMIAAIERLREAGQNVDYIFGPSSAPEVVQRAAAHAPYDAVLIDADHAYAAVKRDFELYARMGRIVILHDIAAPPGHCSRMGLRVEVPKLWREIKDGFRHREIIAPGSDMGIGVIWRDA